PRLTRADGNVACLAPKEVFQQRFTPQQSAGPAPGGSGLQLAETGYDVCPAPDLDGRRVFGKLGDEHFPGVEPFRVVEAGVFAPREADDADAVLECPDDDVIAADALWARHPRPPRPTAPGRPPGGGCRAVTLRPLQRRPRCIAAIISQGYRGVN